MNDLTIERKPWRIYGVSRTTYWRWEKVGRVPKRIQLGPYTKGVFLKDIEKDIAEKQGVSGMNTYLMSLATSLSRSMPMEEYDTWEEFMESLRSGGSSLSAFEEVVTQTDNCMVTPVCPFSRGWEEYTKRIGQFARVHTEVADYYNSNIKPGAINTACVIHQTYRNVAASRIKVAGKSLRCAQIANVWNDGVKKVAPDEWLPIILERAKISQTELNMILRNNACIYMLYTD